MITTPDLKSINLAIEESIKFQQMATDVLKAIQVAINNLIEIEERIKGGGK